MEEKKLFEDICLLQPENFHITNYNRKSISAFNPGAYENEEGKLVIMPRLVFDDRFYVSSIGLCEPISFHDLIDFGNENRNIETNLIKYPEMHQEINGVEDPRITEDGKKVLTVGINLHSSYHTTQTTMMGFDGKKMFNAKPFSFNDSIWNTGRDAVLVNDNILLFRPESSANRFLSYRAFYEEIDDRIEISNKNLEVVLETFPNERKRGFSTNIVRLSSNENLVGFHGALKEKYEYREAFMIINDEGIPIATTDYILKTEGILQYGNRPFTLFGNGLILDNNRLWCIYGFGDFGIVILSTDIENVLNEMVKI